METLRVRIYNVRFGDAILIAVPDAEKGEPKLRHILVDVGNALSKPGGRDFVFKPILEDIQAELDGAPLDLYVMTHEHIDHIQGLYYGEVKEQLPRLTVNTAWLTASAEEGYYSREWPTQDEHGNPMKTPAKALAEWETWYKAITQYTEARNAAGDLLPSLVSSMLLINDPNSSSECVTFLRGLSAGETYYIFRGMEELGAQHPFEVARMQVWAPEENTAVYYGRFRDTALGVAPGPEGAPSQLLILLPPPGVDAGAFYRLVEARKQAYMDNVLTIDKSKNNSSIVFCLEWRGWKLLFPGDAEERSWKEMDKRDVLEPVHFLKISHHASHNGTPEDELLDKVYPRQTPDGRERVAVASTYPGNYGGIPDQTTLKRFKDRGVQTYMVYESLGDESDADEPKLGYLEFSFPAKGKQIDVRVATLDGAG